MGTTLQKVLGVVVVVGALLGALAFLGLTLEGAVGTVSHSFGASYSGDVVSNQQWFSNGFFGGQLQQFAVDSNGNVTLGGTFQIGSSGTKQSNAVDTTCSMIANNSGATNTPAYGYCTGVTGVTSADNVDAGFGTSSTRVLDNWLITAAKASSTPGAIDFRLENLTGASGVMSAQTTIGSTTIIQAGH